MSVALYFVLMHMMKPKPEHDAQAGRAATGARLPQTASIQPAPAQLGR